MKRNILGSFTALSAILLLLQFLIPSAPAFAQHNTVLDKKEMQAKSTLDTATFAGGCFWCMEAQFKELTGVISVTSGFTGGSVDHPTYKQVCTGTTGHAESINVIYNPSKISYDELLAAFFTAHDPTELNRQGNDVGTQYRSAIFYHNANQEKLASYYISKLDASKAYRAKIVTQVEPFRVFYSAEQYHQDYYNNNQDKPYCLYVIKPKLDKFRAVFKNKLKS
jgi:peptide-methionine (S)-S-oxide reductase